MKYIIMILVLVTSSCGSVPLFPADDGRNIGQPHSGYSTGDMGELWEGIWTTAIEVALGLHEPDPVTGIIDGNPSWIKVERTWAPE